MKRLRLSSPFVHGPESVDWISTDQDLRAGESGRAAKRIVARASRREDGLGSRHPAAGPLDVDLSFSPHSGKIWKRTVRAIATEFKTDKNLHHWQAKASFWHGPMRLVRMRSSPEIDVFPPENARLWEIPGGGKSQAIPDE